MARVRTPKSVAGKLATAAAMGAVVGGAPVFLLDPTGPFVAYGSMLLAGVGALTALTAVGAGLAVGGPSRRGHARPGALEVVTTAVVGGAVALLLLMAISSTVAVVGSILAAVVCAALTWWLDHRLAGAEVADRPLTYR